MNRSNPVALVLVPILAASLCLGGCKKKEEVPAATDSAASASSMSSASAPMDSASGAMGADSAASR